MNVIEIPFNLLPDGRKPYFSDILKELPGNPLGQIPDNCIVSKGLCGLGGTFSELTNASRNSIIIEPNKPTIVCKQIDPQLGEFAPFGVYKRVTVDKIIEYIDKCRQGNRAWKIMTTPESFRRVEEAIGYTGLNIRTDCFLLFDEVHHVVDDQDFRKSISLPFDTFFECQHKAIITATPRRMRDKRFELQGFREIVLSPQFDYSVPLKVCVTNNILQQLRQELAEVGKEKPVFIFCNSTAMNYSMAKQLDPEGASIFCSEDSCNNLSVAGFKSAYDSWSLSHMKSLNFFTSRFHNGWDCELDFKPVVIMVTDCLSVEHTMIDPEVDAKQIIGRFRQGIDIAIVISNCNSSFEVRNRDSIEGRVEAHKDQYNIIDALAKTAPDEVMRDTAIEIRDSMPYHNWLDEKGQENGIAIDHYVEQKLLRATYHDRNRLFDAYGNVPAYEVYPLSIYWPLGDTERLQRNALGLAKREKYRIAVSQLQLLADCDSPMAITMKEDIRNEMPLIVEAFENLGKEVIEQLHYSESRIKDALLEKAYKEKQSQSIVLEAIKAKFKPNRWYSCKFIKDTIKRIYEKFGITPPRAVVADEILCFYYGNSKNTSKGRGFQLYESKF